MNHVFWVIPNELAGRPGPNMEPWEPESLFAHGIRSVLTTNGGIDVDAVSLREAGLVHEHLVFPTGEPPDSRQLAIGKDVLPRAYEWYCNAPKPVLAHCSSGKDRTGLFIAYVLMEQHGLSVDEAIKATRKVRPIAFTAYGWESFVHDLLVKTLSR